MKKLLSFIAIVSLIPFMWPQIASANLSTGLVGYWTFDGKDTPWTSSSAATTLDKSGNGNTGTLTNMNQATSPVPGKIGQALYFNGTNQYILATSSQFTLTSSPLNLSTTGTVSVWINPTGPTNEVVIGKSQYATDRNGYSLIYYTNGILRLELCTALAAQLISTSGTAPANKWTHVVYTWDNSFVTAYINGKQDNRVAETQVPVSNVYDLFIGKNGGGNNNYFNGSIDDVRVYNRALSAGEVKQLYLFGLQSHTK